MSGSNSNNNNSTINNIANNQTSASSSSIFVGSLPFNISSSALEAYFSQFARVVKLDLPKNTSSGKLRGFAFIHFQNEDEVSSVLKIAQHVL
jgi:RNA recognition motif-containing protein